jgi:two-component sensor histidine kinase
LSVRDVDDAEGSSSLRELYLVEEITHRVLHDYDEAIASLRLASMSERGPANLALNSAAARLRVRAQAYRALQAPASSGPMELSDYLVQVCAAINTARLAERGAQLTLAAEQVWLDADRCWLVGLIIAELIDNAARYGLSGGPGEIGVRIINGGWRMICAVANRGRASAWDVRGRSRRLVRALSAELGGSIEWRFLDHDCCVWFEFPIERPARALSI